MELSIGCVRRPNGGMRSPPERERSIFSLQTIVDFVLILLGHALGLDNHVRQALHTLDPGKAPGCDGLPTRLIVMVADEIAPCVHHIFTLKRHSPHRAAGVKTGEMGHLFAFLL